MEEGIMAKKLIKEFGDYPANYPDKHEGAVRRANGRCEHCGTDDMYLTPDGHVSGLRLLHINGDRADCRWQNLVLLCRDDYSSVVHGWAIGRPMPKSWIGVPYWIIRRKLEYAGPQQLLLFKV
jgi:hypothetical protein